MEGLEILNSNQIHQRINRMAYEVYEDHFEESVLYLSGITRKGYALAEMMADKLQSVTGKKVVLTQLTLDKKQPLEQNVQLNESLNKLEGQPVIVIDDVINTGRTLFYAIRPFQQIILKKLKVLVLVNRDHLAFPVRPDYTGLSLSTTLQEHISVKLNEEEKSVVLY